VAEGTPEEVAKVKESYTGAFLRDLLGRRAAVKVGAKAAAAAGRNGGVGRKREAAE